MAGSVIDFVKNIFKSGPSGQIKGSQPSSHYRHNHSWRVSFDGETNTGEAGPIKDYYIDYQRLSLRSWQSYLESEITQTVVKKFTKWVVGSSGLKLQAEPILSVLKNNNINIDTELFNTVTEDYFKLFAKSKRSHHAKMRNLNWIAKQAKINAIVGGDVLVIIRFDGKEVNVQLVDGYHVQSPIYGSDDNPYVLKNGHVIKHGIELSPIGEHVAYYVKGKDYNYERIEAVSESSGLSQAFIVYGLEYRIDNNRGLPLISPAIETIAKLKRYKEATVGSAEERQKIAFAIEHGIGSTGENPLNKNLAKALNIDANDGNPVDDNGKELANTISATTNKQAFNMPPDSKLTLLESKNELYFKDFYQVNIDLICAALGIPPEVALSKYDSNFSASRAALKDWEHTIVDERSDFTDQFYQRIYAYWMHVKIMQNKIDAPGYLNAFINDDYEILEAYRYARFVGPGVPHVDPLKEVKAAREKLGELAKNLPLTTVERATEELNGGDSTQNFAQFAIELENGKGFQKPTETE